MARNQTLARRLGQVPVFRSLSTEQLNSLSAATRRVDAVARQVLYEQGESASTCLVVLKGMVQFRMDLGVCTATADLAVEDDIFGLESLRKSAKRQESALAAGAVEVAEIEARALKKLLLDNPRCQLELLGYVVAKLHENSVQSVRNSHQDAEGRIAAFLIDEAGNRRPRRRSVRSALSQAELADYLALTPETFCRKINKFRQLGLISGSGNEYIITQPDALRDLIRS